MFTTYADELESSASRESPGLTADFFAAFPVLETETESPDEFDLKEALSNPSDLDENGVISMLKSSLSASRMQAEMLAQTFGMSSTHKVSATAAGRNAHRAIARLREAKITPPDALLRAISASGGATGRPLEEDPAEPELVLH